MKLFCKHLWRTVLRAPLQPILILLTVIVSTAIAVTAFRLPTMFSAHLYEEYGKKSELGDLTVTLRGDSNTRMLFAEDAEKILGEDGDVLGEFRLSGYVGEGDDRRTVAVSAVDLARADAFYQFDYLSYGTFTTQNLRTSAVLSETLANELGLGVGDRLSLRVLEDEYAFTVQAIAADGGLLTDAEVLIPITSVTHALAVRVPAIATLGDSFLPYTRLLIALDDPADAAAVTDRLSASSAFSDKLVESTDAQAKIHSQELIQTVSLWIPALLLLILTTLLVGTSLKLLQAQRSVEYGIFRACGATSGQLSRLQIAESLVYALIGGVGGILLSAPLLRASSMAYVWQTEPLTVGVGGAVFGLIWAPILMLTSTLLHLRALRRSERESGVRDGRSVPTTDRLGVRVAATLLLILATASLLLTPPQVRYASGVAVLLSLLFWVYLLAPVPLTAVARLSERFFARTRRPQPSLFLSLKSLRQSAPLRQVIRLSVLLCALLLTILTCVSVLGAQSDQLEDFILADTVVLNADATLEEAVAADGGTLATLRFSYHPEVWLDSGAVVLGLSLADDANACVSADMLPKSMPHGNLIAVSEGIASMENLHVGDALTITVKGCHGTFKVSEIVPIHTSLLFFDVTSLGLRNDTMCVLTDSADRESLIATAEPYGAVVLDAEEIFGGLPQTLTGYLHLLEYAVVAALAVTLAGAGNLLAEQYRARRPERHVLRLCGMTRLGILRVTLAELLLILLCTLAVSLPLAYAMCHLVDLGARSFGMTLFL